MRVRLAIGLGLGVVAVGVVVALSLPAPRLQGSNTRLERSGFAVAVPGGGRRCQEGEVVPAGTRELRMFANSHAGPGGPLEITMAAPTRAGGPRRVFARAAVPFGLRQQTLRPRVVPPVTREHRRTVVCIFNRGRSAVEFAGNLTPPVGGGANPYGARLPDEARIDYMRGGEETWWSVAGAVAERFGLVKNTFFGAWTMWAVFALLAAVWAAAVAVLLRWVGRA